MGRLDLYKKDKKKKKKDKEKEDEIWVVEDFEEPYYITPDSEDFKRMKKEPKDIGAFAGGGRVIKYFNRGGGVYDIQVKKIKGKGKVL